MQFHKLVHLAVVVMLVTWRSLSFAQAASDREFRQALLTLQKEQVVTGIYHSVVIEPERCAPISGRTVRDLSDNFRRAYPELMALIETSELLPSIRESLRDATPSTITAKELGAECKHVTDMLRSLLGNEGGKNSVGQMVRVMKQ